MKKLQLLILLFIGFTYEINYRIQGIFYSTEVQVLNYENPDTIKGLYLSYLDKTCTKPDTIWVKLK